MAQVATDGPRTSGRGDEMGDESTVARAQKGAGSLPNRVEHSAGVLPGDHCRGEHAEATYPEITDPKQKRVAELLSRVLLRMKAEGLW